MNIKDSEKIKAKIIVIINDYLETQDENDRISAINELKIFAKFYTVPLKYKIIQKNLETTLQEFILNDKGYNTTIIELYSILLKLNPAYIENR